MPVAGAIADRAQGVIPVTWDALAIDARFGEPRLQDAIDLVKESVFGVVLAPAAESSYPLLVLDYAAKLVALQLIPAGIDYWMNQEISVSATGTNENTTYESRVAALEKLRDQLITETRGLAADVAALVGYRRPLSKSLPRNSDIDTPFLTPSPSEFPRPYQATASS
jgi:hypothetical protein